MSALGAMKNMVVVRLQFVSFLILTKAHEKRVVNVYIELCVMNWRQIATWYLWEFV